MQKKRLAILGSTGSIGTQALDLVTQHPKKYEVEVLTANQNIDLLCKQALKFQPNAVVIANESLYSDLKQRLAKESIKVYAGQNALNQVVQMGTVDMVLSALVGIAGLQPTLSAIEAKKIVALANKETLVVAGDLIRKKLTESNGYIIPIDSEHSAIFQCISGECSPIEKIILTASGGPFLKTPMAEFAHITVSDALNHPKWKMGAKVTIDSATMMNKGFEVIEAKWLFDLKPEQIEVLIHPQSVIHSMVQFSDGSIKAQMGVPDMRTPIGYALSFPERNQLNVPRLNFLQCSNLTFETPDTEKFPCLALSYEALKMGGNAACTLNAANEIAVEAFLQEQIHFVQIAKVVDYCLSKNKQETYSQLDDYIALDAQMRIMAKEWIAGHKK
ncbi:MAG: 1-deoxy-D-xylulose-5-phosphate reductoisomerase [Bacteroidales bacterium]